MKFAPVALWQTSRAIALALTGGALFAAASTFFVSWRIFQSECSSRDVLQPDGNVRMTEALDRYQDLRDGRVLRTLSGYFLQGDTWPPFRSTIALAIFAAAGPSQEADAAISLFFYGLLYLALAIIFLRLGPGWLSGACAFAFCSAMLLSAGELPAYSLASMLETQGMFFLSLAYFALFELYRSPPSPPRWLWIWLAVALVGLAATKYPYALMLLAAALAVEFLRSPAQLAEFVAGLLVDRYRGLRRLLAAAALLAVLAILFAGKLGYTGLNSKTPRYAIWLIALALFLDLNWGFLRQPELLRRAPHTLRAIYLCGAAPFAAWILLHPDRFSSIIGGQFWQPPPGIDPSSLFRSSFFETLFLHIFAHGGVFLILLLAALLALGLLLWRGGGPGTERAGQSPAIETPALRKILPGRQAESAVKALHWLSVRLRPLRHPLASAFFLIWLQFLAQEVFSPNKQDRHIYHFLPAMLLSCSLLVLHTSGFVRDQRLQGLLRYLLPTAFAIAAAALALLPGGALRSDWARVDGRQFCFTGREAQLFEPARWTVRQLEAGRRTIVLNWMHGAPISRGQREQGSEIDLLLRVAAIQAGGAVRNDSRFLWKDWSEFDRLLAVTPLCDAAQTQARVARRAAQVGAAFELLRSAREPGGRICSYEFALSVPGL
ncbi:MAG: hypothetical protein K1X75_06445 [Leptospirales bacterium]|nr:hypothetical protein [Leptospirales bacterium]